MTMLKSIEKNPNIPKRCVDTAIKSASLFESLEGKYPMTLKKTTFLEDTKCHIDYYITLNGRTFTVDIKSYREHLNNDPKNLDEEWVWIEFRNVKGEKGWLYGKADYIVFVFLHEVWFVKRNLLKKFIIEKTEHVKVEYNYQAKYKYYIRKNRNDLVTMAKLGDIRKSIDPIILNID